MLSAGCGCPEPTSIFTVENFPDSGELEIIDVSVDDNVLDMVLENDNFSAFHWRMTVPADVEFRPSLGSVELRVGYPDCFGEGCDPGYFRLLALPSGTLLLEGGEVRSLNDGPSSGAPDVGGVIDLHPNDGCLTRFVGDDETISLQVDEQRQLTVLGAQFVAVGLGGKSSSGFNPFPCADCAQGYHSSKSAFGYLIRSAPP